MVVVLVEFFQVYTYKTAQHTIIYNIHTQCTVTVESQITIIIITIICKCQNNYSIRVFCSQVYALLKYTEKHVYSNGACELATWYTHNKLA